MKLRDEQIQRVDADLQEVNKATEVRATNAEMIAESAQAVNGEQSEIISSHEARLIALEGGSAAAEAKSSDPVA